MGGESWPATKASSRSRVMPVRCGFSRFNRSISSANWGGTTRDWPRSQRACGASAGKTTAAVTQGPIEQGIDRERGALRIRDLIVARGNHFGAAGEFSTGKSLQHQGSDQAITEQGDFFRFRIHGEHLATSATIRWSRVGEQD